MKNRIDAILKYFGYPESQVDDDIFYFYDRGDGKNVKNGFSMDIEDRDFTWKTLVGDRVEKKPHYVLYQEVYESNYPTEPDWVDIAERGEFLDPLSAVAEMMKLDMEAKIENYFEMIAEIRMEESYT